MKNKGFTLIELLAVIVILAIIALIATPIILGIIEDAKNNTEEENINLYAKAVENAVANYVLKNPSDTNITLDKIKEYIKYDGNKVECNITINEDKTVNLNNCKINDKEVEYTYGAPTLVEYITNLYNPNSTVINNGITYNIDTTNKIIDDGLGGTVSSGGNLRYYGANPENYIDIGDKDINGNPILWRIIGVFETKYATEALPCNVDSDNDGHYDNCASDKLVKIIRNYSLGDMAWDSNDVNNWSTSTLNTYLNVSTYYPLLNNNVKNKIENTLWNLGGYTNSQSYSNDMYWNERGTTIHYTASTTEWVGKVGLMYLSDYGYATDLTKCSENLYNYKSSTDSYACRTNDWLYNSLYQWTLSSFSSNSHYVFYVDSTGNVNCYSSYDARGVRPVLYLKPNVSITGEGTTSDGINYKIVG